MHRRRQESKLQKQESEGLITSEVERGGAREQDTGDKHRPHSGRWTTEELGWCVGHTAETV